MTHTKPSQEELYGALLTGVEQYRQEIENSSVFPCEQQEALFDRARQGDMQARHEIIEHCLGYVEYWASRLFRACRWYSWRIEYEELISVGNLALMECVDKVLWKEAPFPYLKKVAKLEMQRYCHYHQSLIALPERDAGENIPVDSLDVPCEHQEGEVWYGDILEAPPVVSAGPARSYEALYQSFNVLTQDQRAVIEHCYGLGENPCDTLAEVYQQQRSDGSQMCKTASYAMHAKALRKLHTALQSPQEIQASYPMREACQVLHVTPTTLSVFVSQGCIRKFGRGIYSKDDVDQLAQERACLSA